MLEFLNFGIGYVHCACMLRMCVCVMRDACVCVCVVKVSAVIAEFNQNGYDWIGEYFH